MTCIEHKKAENPFDPQGLRLTVVFRILLDQAKNIASNHVCLFIVQTDFKAIY